ncbi:YonK family protein [Brevibacillus laterosporus]|uniref:YonK family protein n=1 Tax=Brevibacillus laterosporus TaxID=1465 RepID=UPI00215CE0D0|nr:YonK family protein [Brevibacillus laterosporus]MCR8994638.1 YonK family protein [Brevibacillus laterosporus]
MSKVKSTKSLGYSLKGILDLEAMTITEMLEDEEVVHDIKPILKAFHDKEVSLAIKMTDKLDGDA